MNDSQTKKIANFINTKIDLLELVRSHGMEPKEETAGRYRMKCPMHNENTASFFIYPNNSYYCFGCANGGKVINFMMHQENVTYDEIIEKFRGDVDVESDKFFVDSLLKNLNKDSFNIFKYKKDTQYQIGIYLRELLYKHPEKTDAIFGCYREMDVFFNNDSILDQAIVDTFVDQIMEKV